MTRAERRLRNWLLATGAVYAFGAVDFIARPAGATASLSGFGGTALDRETPGFYNALAAAYMATIATLALSAGRDPASKRDLIPPLLIAKAASSGAMLYRYFRTQRRGFAVGSALDAVLLGVTAGLFAGLE